MTSDRAALSLAPPFAALDRQLLIGRLARAMAHQIASPMTALVVMADYLRQQLPPDGAAHADAGEIQRAAQRCSDLLEAFRAVARRERGPQPVAVSLSQLVDDLAPLLGHALLINRLTLETAVPAALRPARGHRADVEHLLLRLLFAAADRAPNGAAIRVAGHDEGRAVTLSIAIEAQAPVGAEPLPLVDELGRATCAELVGALGAELELEQAPPGARLRLPPWS